MSVVIKHIMVVGRQKACDKKAMQGDEELLNHKKQLEIKMFESASSPLITSETFRHKIFFFFFSKNKE